MGVLSGVSVSHSDATVAQIEDAAAASQRAALGELIGEPLVEEAFVLQTCNRVEAYVVTDQAEQGRRVLASQFADTDESIRTTLDHEGSLRHLMRVAAGLESLVLGEDQIIGQVRDAYEDARAVGAVGPVLENAVPKAIHVGERARTETAINEGVVSLGSAAVELATAERSLDGETALVVGAGEMATLTAKALDGRTDVDRLLVANRTVPHAEHVVDSVDTDGAALGLDALPAATEAAALVVTATGSPGTVFDTETLSTAGETVVVDLAQPHDVPAAAADLASVAAYDLDDLEAVTTETRERRQDAAMAVEEYVDEGLEELLTQFKRERADAVISAMYESAERLKASELDRALSEMDLDDEQQRIVESMADSIVNQLLAPPTTSLRDAAEEDDWSTINTALKLFDPEFSGETEMPETFVGEMSPEDLPDEIPEAAREQMPAAVLEQLDD
jgi:glutamyl-tRNA reductase